MASPVARLSHLHPVARGVRLHARLVISCAIGIAAALVLPGQWALTSRMLCGWDVAIALYLAATSLLIVRSDVGRLRQRAAEDDEGAVAVTFLSALAALASIGAIFLELAAAKANPGALGAHAALAVATIVLSWLFTHQFYGEEGGRGEGLEFPGKAAPNYRDFVYFSFVIGMTSQVSDVVVTSPAMRRTVIAHGVLSFAFNTTLIALTVNMASNAF